MTKYQCLRCGRANFDKPNIPHTCNGQFRKHGLTCIPVEPEQNDESYCTKCDCRDNLIGGLCLRCRGYDQPQPEPTCPECGHPEHEGRWCPSKVSIMQYCKCDKRTPADLQPEYDWHCKFGNGKQDFRKCPMLYIHIKGYYPTEELFQYALKTLCPNMQPEPTCPKWHWNDECACGDLRIHHTGWTGKCHCSDESENPCECKSFVLVPADLQPEKHCTLGYKRESCPSADKKASCKEQRCPDLQPEPTCPDCGHPEHEGKWCLSRVSIMQYCKCDKRTPADLQSEQMPLREEIFQQIYSVRHGRKDGAIPNTKDVTNHIMKLIQAHDQQVQKAFAEEVHSFIKEAVRFVSPKTEVSVLAHILEMAEEK